MFFVSVNHCDALQLLVERQNYASAFALLRPTFENSFRAVWLNKCANESQVEKAIQKADWPPVRNLIESIEEHTKQSKLFSILWSKLKTFAHDFTHGGIQLAGRHISENGVITPHISQKEIELLLEISVLVSTYILGEFIELSGDKRALPLFEKLVNETNQWLFAKAC